MCEISTRLKCFMNWECFSAESGFVKPSAGISVVGTHRTSTVLSLRACLSHRFWMSICFTFDNFCGLSFWISPEVCWVSQSIRDWCSGSNSICLNSRYRPIVSFAVRESESNSASVIDLVTVFCLEYCHIISPWNSFMRYPCVDRRVSGSPANDALLNSWSNSSPLVPTAVVFFPTEPKNAMAWYFVARRYARTRFASHKCSDEGFIVNWLNWLAAKGTSDRDTTAVYRIEPTFSCISVICWMVACPLYFCRR